MQRQRAWSEGRGFSLLWGTLVRPPRGAGELRTPLAPEGISCRETPSHAACASAACGRDHKAEAVQHDARGQPERTAGPRLVEEVPGLGQQENAAAQPGEGESGV